MGSQTEMYANTDVAFLDADVVQLVKMLPPDEISMVLSTLDLDTKKLIFLPVNDNASTQSGGSHWSLLLWDKSLNRFEYYDSIESCTGSENIARSLSKTFSK